MSPSVMIASGRSRVPQVRREVILSTRQELVVGVMKHLLQRRS